MVTFRLPIAMLRGVVRRTSRGPLLRLAVSLSARLYLISLRWTLALILKFTLCGVRATISGACFWCKVITGNRFPVGTSSRPSTRSANLLTCLILIVGLNGRCLTSPLSCSRWLRTLVRKLVLRSTRWLARTFLVWTRGGTSSGLLRVSWPVSCWTRLISRVRTGVNCCRVCPTRKLSVIRFIVIRRTARLFALALRVLITLPARLARGGPSRTTW